MERVSCDATDHRCIWSEGRVTRCDFCVWFSCAGVWFGGKYGHSLITFGVRFLTSLRMEPRLRSLSCLSLVHFGEGRGSSWNRTSWTGPLSTPAQVGLKRHLRGRQYCRELPEKLVPRHRKAGRPLSISSDRHETMKCTLLANIVNRRSWKEEGSRIGWEELALGNSPFSEIPDVIFVGHPSGMSKEGGSTSSVMKVKTNPHLGLHSSNASPMSHFGLSPKQGCLGCQALSQMLAVKTEILTERHPSDCVASSESTKSMTPLPVSTRASQHMHTIPTPSQHSTQTLSHHTEGELIENGHLMRSYQNGFFLSCGALLVVTSIQLEVHCRSILPRAENQKPIGTRWGSEHSDTSEVAHKEHQCRRGHDFCPSTDGDEVVG